MVTATVHKTDKIHVDIEVAAARLRAVQRSGHLHEIILNLNEWHFVFLRKWFPETLTAVRITVAQNAALVDFTQGFTEETASHFCALAYAHGIPFGLLTFRVPCVTEMETTTLLMDVVRGRTLSVPITIITTEEPRHILQYVDVAVQKAA